MALQNRSSFLFCKGRRLCVDGVRDLLYGDVSQFLTLLLDSIVVQPPASW